MRLRHESLLTKRDQASLAGACLRPGRQIPPPLLFCTVDQSNPVRVRMPRTEVEDEVEVHSAGLGLDMTSKVGVYPYLSFFIPLASNTSEDYLLVLRNDGEEKQWLRSNQVRLVR